jgi:beta-catenin-like protein 1
MLLLKMGTLTSFAFRERTLARIRAVKVLNYALAGSESKELCLRFVDAAGLKHLFPLFMGKGSRKLKKSHQSSYSESEDEGTFKSHTQ